MLNLLFFMALSLCLTFPGLARQSAATQPTPNKQKATKSSDVKESQSKTSPAQTTPMEKAAQSQSKMAAAEGAFTETFEDGWDSSWHFTKNVSVVSDPEGKGYVLSIQDPGFADVGREFKDFTLDFRIKPAKEGQEAPVIQVSLRVKGEPPQQSSYQVILHQKRSEVRREVKQQQRTLAQAHQGLTPDTWQKVSIKLVGGQIDVSLEDQQILSANDTKNLPSGLIAFFCHGGGKGFLLDDITITPVSSEPSGKSSAATSTPTQKPSSSKK